jgi:N-acetylneuraminic acid mutarotase
MSIARDGPGAILLPSGQVLVMGGYSIANDRDGLASTELYNPVADSWTAGLSMPLPRGGPGAALLADGRVLVTGGWNYDYGGCSMISAIYDPQNCSWTSTNFMSQGRCGQTMTLLPSGQMVVVGGQGTGQAPWTAELFDLAPGAWRYDSSFGIRVWQHTATLLPNGTVLIIGFYDTNSVLTVERYDPNTDHWVVDASMLSVQAGATGTLLPNGSLLIAGGENGAGGAVQDIAELYTS